MFSIVKIDNGIFLDGKKLNCVRSYKLKQKAEDGFAEITIKMDVRTFYSTIDDPHVSVEGIEVNELSGILFTDLLKVIKNDSLLKVCYTEHGVIKISNFPKDSAEAESIKWRGKTVKIVTAKGNILEVELED